MIQFRLRQIGMVTDSCVDEPRYPTLHAGERQTDHQDFSEERLMKTPRARFPRPHLVIRQLEIGLDHCQGMTWLQDLRQANLSEDRGVYDTRRILEGHT